ncbi:MAG: cupin domain-containing protein [Devosia sp.]
MSATIVRRSPDALQLPLDGDVPNNELPVLIYRSAARGDDLDTLFRDTFQKHGWSGIWVDGVFGYNHCHSNAHEVLGVVAGTAELMISGEQGRTVELSTGDVIVLPAGTGHRRLIASAEFLVMGAYPKGQEGYDVYTPALDFANGRARLRSVRLPEQDPLYGPGGPLLKFWAA